MAQGNSSDPECHNQCAAAQSRGAGVMNRPRYTAQGHAGLGRGERSRQARIRYRRRTLWARPVPDSFRCTHGETCENTRVIEAYEGVCVPDDRPGKVLPCAKCQDAVFVLARVDRRAGDAGCRRASECDGAPLDGRSHVLHPARDGGCHAARDQRSVTVGAACGAPCREGSSGALGDGWLFERRRRPSRGRFGFDTWRKHVVSARSSRRPMGRSPRARRGSLRPHSVAPGASGVHLPLARVHRKRARHRTRARCRSGTRGATR